MWLSPDKWAFTAPTLPATRTVLLSTHSQKVSWLFMAFSGLEVGLACMVPAGLPLFLQRHTTLAPQQPLRSGTPQMPTTTPGHGAVGAATAPVPTVLLVLENQSPKLLQRQTRSGREEPTLIAGKQMELVLITDKEEKNHERT